MLLPHIFRRFPAFWLHFRVPGCPEIPGRQSPVIILAAIPGKRASGLLPRGRDVCDEVLKGGDAEASAHELHEFL